MATEQETFDALRRKTFSELVETALLRCRTERTDDKMIVTLEFDREKLTGWNVVKFGDTCYEKLKG